MSLPSAFLLTPPSHPFPEPHKRALLRRPRITPRQHPRATLSTRAYNWTDQWYPIALTKDLHPRKPNPVMLLSTPLVAFLSKNVWVVLHDRCPHRHTSLSGGRVVQHNLECPYHGWQFDNTGAVCRIPQSLACPAIAATKVRTHTEHGIVFCSLGNPASPPPLVNWGSTRFVVSEFSRVLPLCFTTVIQNLLDPAHIHFAHHGSIGRRESATEVPIRILSSATEEGFLADYYSGSVRLRFRPPCLVEIVTLAGLSFAYYTTPISRSRCKAFALRTTAYRQFFVPPRWMDHLRRHKLLEDDLGLMREQQRYMARGGGYHRSWREFCMPASADRLIVEMKRWLDSYAPVEEWYGCCDGDDEGRWGHTKECLTCWRIWWMLGNVRRGVRVAGIVFLLAAAGFGSVALATVAGVLAALVGVLRWAQRKFE